jgi:pre-mRNA-splicing factor ATP-dependent RNA helicase DHX15/PRP43
MWLRLLEFAPKYFDVDSFPDGETKRALVRIVNKKTGKTESRRPKAPNGESRPVKRQRKQ